MNATGLGISFYGSSLWLASDTFKPPRDEHVDFAEVLRQLIDDDYPHAERIVFVANNLKYAYYGSS